MGQMIQVKNEEQKFKFRVSGLLIHDNKLLTVDMDDSGFLCLPGGYVELGEDSKTAILREMEEEVKYSVNVNKCIAVIENFFVNKKGIKMHEVAFYYLLDIINDNKETLEDYEFIENDNGNMIKHQFKWIRLEDIKNIDLKPSILKDKLFNKDFDFSHIIYKEI